MTFTKNPPTFTKNPLFDGLSAAQVSLVTAMVVERPGLAVRDAVAMGRLIPDDRAAAACQSMGWPIVRYPRENEEIEIENEFALHYSNFYEYETGKGSATPLADVRECLTVEADLRLGDCHAQVIRLSFPNRPGDYDARCTCFWESTDYASKDDGWQGLHNEAVGHLRGIDNE